MPTMYHGAKRRRKREAGIFEREIKIALCNMTSKYTKDFLAGFYVFMTYFRNSPLGSYTPNGRSPSSG